MKTIHHVLDVGAGTPALWAALTTSTGLAGWWSQQVSVSGPQERPQVRFVFDADFNPVMQVADMVDGQRLVCRCTGGHANWQDNTFSFVLEERKGETLLMFSQDYARELSDEVYGTYNYNWGYYANSLKLLCEKGVGAPFSPATES